jgi:hypothetical protein
VEGVGLPSRTVEGEHQLPAQPLVQRVLGDELLELADDAVVATERELAVDPVHDGSEAQLLEPLDVGARGRLEAEAGEGAAAPERERLLEQLQGFLDRARRLSRARGGDRALEPDRVELVGRQLEHVPVGVRRDRVPAVGELFAQQGDVDLNGLDRTGRRVLAPELVDQALPGHDLVRVEEQHREQSLLLGRAESQGQSVVEHVQRTEDAVVDPPVLPLVERDWKVRRSARGGAR